MTDDNTPAAKDDTAGFKAEDYWHQEHGDTRKWDYTRDDIENAFKAGYAAAIKSYREES